jgi:hypothetical protein
MPRRSHGHPATITRDCDATGIQPAVEAPHRRDDDPEIGSNLNLEESRLTSDLIAQSRS